MANSQKPSVAVFWHRRDLRLEDNAGLAKALASGLPVLPLFIFDSDILGDLEDRDDARVDFIHREILRLDRELKARGSELRVEIGEPVEAWRRTLREFDVRAAFANEDYEPYAVARDARVAALLEAKGAKLDLVKDHVIFAKREVAKDDGEPYTVYGAYARKWRALASAADFASAPSEDRLDALLARPRPAEPPSLERIGFAPSGRSFPSSELVRDVVARYADRRDDMELEGGTSRLGLHLRFGTLSARGVARFARASRGYSADVFLGELIWREFFAQILWNFPHVVEGPFRPQFASVPFRHDERDFAAWREGRTGYPVVDAGMRELSQAGFMHNRARMITASFLVKHLLIDWRWGEAWFARKLLDYDLASNNGNWQWVAGCGCDAAPYFRVFNPELQAKKFDANGEYARRWVPELSSGSYPAPIVDHKMARGRALAAYAKGLGRKAPAPTRLN